MDLIHEIIIFTNLKSIGENVPFVIHRIWFALIGIPFDQPMKISNWAILLLTILNQISVIVYNTISRPKIRNLVEVLFPIIDLSSIIFLLVLAFNQYKFQLFLKLVSQKSKYKFRIFILELVLWSATIIHNIMRFKDTPYDEGTDYIINATYFDKKIDSNNSFFIYIALVKQWHCRFSQYTFFHFFNIYLIVFILAFDDLKMSLGNLQQLMLIKISKKDILRVFSEAKIVKLSLQDAFSSIFFVGLIIILENFILIFSIFIYLIKAKQFDSIIFSVSLILLNFHFLVILLVVSLKDEKLQSKLDETISKIKLNWNESYSDLQFFILEIKDAFGQSIIIWDSFVIRRPFILNFYYSLVIFSILFVQVNNGALGEFDKE